MAQTTARVRPPAVAGRFYPGAAQPLQDTVQQLLEAAGEESPPHGSEQPPRAAVLPHAGYPFSGIAAARGYRHFAPLRGRIHHVVLLGPAHFVDLHGIALPEAQALATPLGTVAVNESLREQALEQPDVHVNDAAHAHEHSLEVHLPFLQVVLPETDLLPLAVGRISPPSCGKLLESLWREDTLLLVSSDLSHFHDDSTARLMDAETTAAIESGTFETITPERACGAAPLRGLLWLARKHGLQARTVAQCNSGDVTGDRSAVVGYGSYVFH
ncbi:MAG: AmmeMemoRadiSam system protein B [Halorhodospira sp.]